MDILGHTEMVCNVGRREWIGIERHNGWDSAWLSEALGVESFLHWLNAGQTLNCLLLPTSRMRCALSCVSPSACLCLYPLKIPSCCEFVFPLKPMCSFWGYLPSFLLPLLNRAVNWVEHFRCFLLVHLHFIHIFIDWGITVKMPLYI